MTFQSKLSVAGSSDWFYGSGIDLISKVSELIRLVFCKSLISWVNEIVSNPTMLSSLILKDGSSDLVGENCYSSF